LISISPRLSLEAIVTSRPDRQAAARRRYPGAEVMPALDDLLGRAGDFDVAVVTVPNAAHVGVAEASLRAGLSVVVDKPVAPSAAAAEMWAHWPPRPPGG
jgi:predicted dehydrogenase